MPTRFDPNTGGIIFTPQEKDNEVIIKDASDFPATIDSTKVYFIDGLIDLGTTEIEVPSGGMFLNGHGYGISGLYTSENNHTMFKTVSGTSGDFIANNIYLYSSGTNSKLFDLDNGGTNGAIEFNSCNLGTFPVATTELGELNNYRQFRTSDCAIININDGLTFSGTWAGGFAINDTILLIIPAAVTVFKEGTSLSFQGSSLSNLNAFSINATTIVYDFQPSNFVLDEGFQLNGARFNLASTPVPNMPLNSTKRFFKNCTGVENTFSGGTWSVTTETITPLTVNVPAKMLGTTTYADLVYFSNTTDNAFVFDSTVTKNYIVSGMIVIDGGANDEITVTVRQWDDSASSYIDLREYPRTISNLLGGLDIAYYTIEAYAKLEQNDRIEIWLTNTTDGTDATALIGSFINLNVRL